MSQTSRSILRFIGKTILMTLPVLLPAILFYLWADPFRVLTSSVDFYSLDNSPAPKVGLNKGMVTLRNYEEQLRRGHKYNAFIFGSSITCYYDAEEWRELLGRDSVSPYHFDSSSESLEQMAEKVEYLDRTGTPLDYALIVLDPYIMTKETDDSPMSIHSPALSSNPLQFLKYHYTFFRASTNSDFLKSWIPGRLSGENLQLGRNPVFEVQPIVYNPVTNQESLPEWDRMIASDPEKFYSQFPLMKSPEKASVGASAITPEREERLKRIANIFQKHSTDYQIIVSPNRRKITLNPQDYKVLESIFGKDRIHDYSLSNVNDLENDTLLYDNTHYRPSYASKLMRLTYGN